MRRQGTILFGLAATALMCGAAWYQAAEARPEFNWLANGNLEQAAADGKSPAGFTLSGDAAYGTLGTEGDRIGQGVRLQSAVDANGDGQKSGSLTTTRGDLTPADGRWFRLRVRGMAQEGFKVEDDGLFLQVDFAKDQGKNSLDHVRKKVYALIEQDRLLLADPLANKKLGGGTWRWYDLEFRTPFPHVDTLKLSAGFEKGTGGGEKAEFLIDEMVLEPIGVPGDYQAPAGKHITRSRDDAKSLVPLGGRWYYAPPAADRTPPAQFDHTNADRLFYLSDRLEAPFAGNTDSWLRRGFLDLAGNTVTEDRFVQDSLTITFTPTHLVMHTKNLPNHPTATFPDRTRGLDGNPNYVQEQNDTYRIPLEPKVNPNHRAMKNGTNVDGIMPPGPVGVAINGVMFFNPFDASQDIPAIDRLDRCCGHPSPGYEYHYHKYPVCVKTPWSDDGEEHSPLIGFALDGFPIYGPYESKGVLAKDATANPLNEFNVHEDPERGWHYHVTPATFPYLIGGFWGEAETRRGPPGGPGGGKGKDKGGKGKDGKGKGKDGKGPPPGKGDKGKGPPPGKEGKGPKGEKGPK